MGRGQGPGARGQVLAARVTVSFMILALMVAPRLSAQNSAYSVLGVGFPSSPWSVIARSMAGSIAAIDPASALNPAAIGLSRVLSTQAASMQEFRHYTIGGVTANGLQQTRFPFGSVTAPMASKYAYGLGFTQYAERSYDISTSDTVILRGIPVGVTDRSSAAGGIVDIRGALAWNTGPKLIVGVAGHVLGGSSKVSTNRAFTDSSYRSFTDVVDGTFSGFGVSAGVVVSPATSLHLGASARMDTKLKRTVGGDQLPEIDLPVTLAAGVEYRPSPFLRVASTGIWRSWSSASSSFAAAGTKAFDTFDTSVGVEVGGGKGGFPIPLRLGFRYATLPFSPNASQPKEIDLSAGSGLSVSRGRALILAAIERAMRDGGGLTERSWQFTIGFQIRP